MVANGTEVTESFREDEASKGKAAKMNRQARVLFNFISSSSGNDFLTLQGTSAQHYYYQHLIYSSLSYSLYTTEGFESLGRQLADIARHAHFSRRMDVVEQLSQIMLVLPASSQLKSVARHYQALCAKRQGDYEGARKVLEHVVEEATPQYKAIALQIIGATHYERREVDKALPFYIAAGKAATNCDLLTWAESQRMIAIVRSIHGDHHQALKDIENLFPLVRVIAKRYPMLYYSFLNSLAVELGEVGRISEAQSVCQITLTSPFVRAYPEWLDTRDELEAKRTSATTSTVAVSATPAPGARSSRKIKPALSVAVRREGIFIQRSAAIVVTTTILSIETTTSILDRVEHSICPRGPPACF